MRVIRVQTGGGGRTGQGSADRSQHIDVFRSLRTFFSWRWKKSFKVIGFLVWLPSATPRVLAPAVLTRELKSHRKLDSIP